MFVKIARWVAWMLDGVLLVIGLAGVPDDAERWWSVLNDPTLQWWIIALAIAISVVLLATWDVAPSLISGLSKGKDGQDKNKKPTPKPRQHNMPIREALVFMTGIDPGESTGHGQHFEAVKVIRQAAVDERISIWGRELKHTALDELLRPIDPRFWNDNTINPATIFASRPLSMHQTRAATGRQGGLLRYGDIHVNKEEIEGLKEEFEQTSSQNKSVPLQNQESGSEGLPDLNMRDAACLVGGIKATFMEVGENFQEVEDALTLIRLLALREYVTIWGRQIKKDGKSGDLGPIPPEYWENKTFTHLIIDSRDLGHAHTANIDSARHGSGPDYTDTRVFRSDFNVLPLRDAAEIAHERTRNTTLAHLTHDLSNRDGFGDDPVMEYAAYLWNQSGFRIYGNLGPSTDRKEIPEDEWPKLYLTSAYALAFHADSHPTYTNIAVEMLDLQARIRRIEETFSVVE